MTLCVLLTILMGCGYKQTKSFSIKVENLELDGVSYTPRDLSDVLRKRGYKMETPIVLIAKPDTTYDTIYSAICTLCDHRFYHFRLVTSPNDQPQDFFVQMGQLSVTPVRVDLDPLTKQIFVDEQKTDLSLTEVLNNNMTKYVIVKIYPDITTTAKSLYKILETCNKFKNTHPMTLPRECLEETLVKKSP